MNYGQVLSFLKSRGNEVQGINLGLHRIQTIMGTLGNPHLRLDVVHIAGTNGKGSVAAMIDSILRQAGLSVGLYTSPHLETVRERIRLGGRDIHPRRFAALMTRIRTRELELRRSNVLDMPLTYFELITACMFLHFAETEVDVAVVEVGMGGAYDATNIVRPQVSVITGVSLDHQQWLGDTVARIAREKAGIIKSGVPVISGCRTLEAKRVIRSRASALGAPLMELDRSCRLRVKGVRRGRCVMDLKTPARDYRDLRLALAGEHQARNAALAVLAVEALKPFHVSLRAYGAGLARTCWPGRLDEYRCRRRTLLDGAHNAEGAAALRSFLLNHGPEEIHLVFGVLRDKDAHAIGRLLFPLARSIHLTAIANPRSADPSALVAQHGRFRQRFRIHSNARTALHAAWEECSSRGMVVVTGSLYLLGEVRPLLLGPGRNR